MKTKIILLLMAAMAAFAGLAAFAPANPTTQAGMTALLVIDGVHGNWNGAHHQGAIEVQSFSWGAQNRGGSLARGGVFLPSMATVGDLSIRKQVDASSPVLSLACLEGRVFRQARLFVYQPGGATPYMQVELDDVMVKSTSLSGGSGEAPTESFALGSRRIRWTFPQVSTNGREASRLSWGWNKDKNERF